MAWQLCQAAPDQPGRDVVRVVRTDWVTPTQTVRALVEEFQVKLRHLVYSTGRKETKQRPVRHDAVSSVIIVAVGQPNYDVMALRPITCHHESDVDLFGKSGVPLLAKGF